MPIMPVIITVDWLIQFCIYASYGHVYVLTFRCLYNAHYVGSSQLGVEGAAEISTASAFRALGLMRCVVDMTEVSATEEGVREVAVVAQWRGTENTWGSQISLVEMKLNATLINELFMQKTGWGHPDRRDRIHKAKRIEGCVRKYEVFSMAVV